MVAEGCAWLWGACMVVGGMHGCQGMCMVAGGMCGCGGHAWLWGACMVAWGACVVARGVCMVAGGMHGCGGHEWLRGAYMGYDEILSMNGRYASYWNAFLLKEIFTHGNENWQRCMKCAKIQSDFILRRLSVKV